MGYPQPGMGYPLPQPGIIYPQARNGVPSQDRTADGVLDMPQSVCLLHSRRRTFLLVDSLELPKWLKLGSRIKKVPIVNVCGWWRGPLVLESFCTYTWRVLPPSVQGFPPNFILLIFVLLFIPLIFILPNFIPPVFILLIFIPHFCSTFLFRIFLRESPMCM